MNTNSVQTFADYVGRSETTPGRVERSPMALMAALLDRSLEEAAPDGALPPLWHWCLFQAPVRRSQIGPDGHPRRGGFMPPVALPRRMFAGARTEWRAPLRLGVEAALTKTIASVVPKSGRSGELVFVTVRQEISGPQGVAIVEEQDIVYREQGAPVPMPTERKPVPAADWERIETVTPDPVMLFRFSCATGNSHRIHYDAPYTTSEEGYPGLVIHGPLLAILLADLCRRHRGGPLPAFKFQAKRPAFLGTALHCCLRDEGDLTRLAVIDDYGQECMAAEAAR